MEAPPERPLWYTDRPVDWSWEDWELYQSLRLPVFREQLRRIFHFDDTRIRAYEARHGQLVDDTKQWFDDVTHIESSPPVSPPLSPQTLLRQLQSKPTVSSVPTSPGPRAPTPTAPPIVLEQTGEMGSNEDDFFDFLSSVPGGPTINLDQTEDLPPLLVERIQREEFMYPPPDDPRFGSPPDSVQEVLNQVGRMDGPSGKGAEEDETQGWPEKQSDKETVPLQEEERRSPATLSDPRNQVGRMDGPSGKGAEEDETQEQQRRPPATLNDPWNQVKIEITFSVKLAVGRMLTRIRSKSIITGLSGGYLLTVREKMDRSLGKTGSEGFSLWLDLLAAIHVNLPMLKNTNTFQGTLRAIKSGKPAPHAYVFVKNRFLPNDVPLIQFEGMYPGGHYVPFDENKPGNPVSARIRFLQCVTAVESPLLLVTKIEQHVQWYRATPVLTQLDAEVRDALRNGVACAGALLEAYWRSFTQLCNWGSEFPEPGYVTWRRWWDEMITASETSTDFPEPPPMLSRLAECLGDELARLIKVYLQHAARLRGSNENPEALGKLLNLTHELFPKKN